MPRLLESGSRRLLEDGVSLILLEGSQPPIVPSVLPSGRRRRSKPWLGARIDVTHPLSQGLQGFYPLNEQSGLTANDLTNNLPLPIASVATWSSNTSGAMLSCVTTSAGASSPLPPALQYPFPITIAFRGQRNTANSTGNAFGCIGTSTRTVWGMYWSDTLHISCMDGGTFVTWDTGFLPPIGQEFTASLTIDGLSVRFYVNGSLYFSAASTQTGPSYGSTQPQMAIGASPTFTTPSRTGFSWCMWWNRSLTSQEHANLAANAWDVMQPLPHWTRRQVTAVSWNGTTTVSARVTASSTGTGTVPAYAGTVTVSRGATAAATGTSLVPAYAGNTAISRHPAIVSSGTAVVPMYTSTVVASRHPTVASSGGSVVPTYAGTVAVSGHPTAASSGTAVVPTYTGTAAISRGATASSTGTSVKVYMGTAAVSRRATANATATVSIPTYAGTATISPRKSISAAGSSPPPTYAGSCVVASSRTIAAAGTRTTSAYNGSCTVSSRKSLASAGTRTVPSFSGSASASAHPLLHSAASHAVPVYTGVCTVATRHPAISGSESFVTPDYSGSSAFSIRVLFSGMGIFAMPHFTGSGAMTIGHPAFASSALVGTAIYTGDASLIVEHPIADMHGVNTFVVITYATVSRVTKRFEVTVSA